MSPSILVKSSPSADALFVVSVTAAFIIYLALAGLECYYAATLHPYRVAIIFIILCFVGYVSYGNESVSAATSQSTLNPPPPCLPGQEPTSTAPRSPRPKSKSKRKLKSELKVKPELKSEQPESTHDLDPKPQQTAPQSSTHPRLSPYARLGPAARRNDLSGPAPISLAPCHIIEFELARQRPPRARPDPPSHIRGIFAPKSKSSSSAPTNVAGERPTTPATTPASQPTPVQSTPKPATSQPPSPTPAQKLAGRVHPASPSLTPLRDAKRQRTLDSPLSLAGPATLGSHKVQSDAPSTPSLGLGDPALAPCPGSPMLLDSPQLDVPSQHSTLGLDDPAPLSCPSPVSEHPGSPMLLDSPGSPTLSNSPGSPMLLDSPRLNVPSRPRSMALPVSPYIHGPRVSTAEMIRPRGFTHSALPPQDEVMRGPGMGDMDLDGAEAARVFIEQDVEMAPRVVIEEDAEMDVLEQDVVMAC